MNNIGIYKITNLINNKVYIGQSVNVKKRFSEHKRKLSNNSHNNEHLQNTYNYYGKDNFTFEIIENCSEDDLTNRELFWIYHYKSYEREYGYNKNMPDSNIERFTFNEETKRKIGEANRKYDKKELISYLHDYYYHFGKVPTQRDLAIENYPTHKVYFEEFGSFKQALIEAGLYDFVDNKKLYERLEYSKDDVYEKFKDFINKNGRFPNAYDLKDTKNNNLPTTSVIIKHYKSIENLKYEFGYDKQSNRERENKESLLMLRKLYEKEGFITSRTIDKSRDTRSVKFYANRFGTLLNAYELAGIPIEQGVINGTVQAVRMQFLPIGGYYINLKTTKRMVSFNCPFYFANKEEIKWKSN